MQKVPVINYLFPVIVRNFGLSLSYTIIENRSNKYENINDVTMNRFFNLTSRSILRALKNEPLNLTIIFDFHY